MDSADGYLLNAKHERGQRLGGGARRGACGQRCDSHGVMRSQSVSQGVASELARRLIETALAAHRVKICIAFTAAAVSFTVEAAARPVVFALPAG